MWRLTIPALLCLVCVGAQPSLIEYFKCQLPVNLKKEIFGYQSFVNRIISEAEGKYAGRFFDDLAAFVDKFGNRLTGTQNLEDSINYIATKSIADGLKVRLDPVPVPYWIRGEESARLLCPREKELKILGLGFSIGTNSSGLVADAIVVSSFDELVKNAKEVKGKIVVFNNPYVDYGTSVKYRRRGPAVAGNLGAVAALVRSVTPFSIYSPHTGTTKFGVNDTRIPAASITLEDADMLGRMYKAGYKLRIRLKMESKMEYNKTSHNLIADIPGAILPDNYVTVSGHIDSWDVGQGALDDGVGAFLGLHSLLLLKFIKAPPPKRTIRGIMWTGEELGLLGAESYLEKHKDEIKNWTAALESDSGLYHPLGLSFNGTEEAYCIMKEILGLFKSLNANQVKKNPWVGSDIAVFQPYGVPLADPLNADSNYMWFHHTEGDSMRTQDSKNMDKNLAIFAATSYILANLSVPLPREGQSVWEMMKG